MTDTEPNTTGHHPEPGPTSGSPQPGMAVDGGARSWPTPNPQVGWWQGDPSTPPTTPTTDPTPAPSATVPAASAVEPPVAMAGAVTGTVPRAAATGPAHRMGGHQAEPRINERGGDGFPLWPAQQMRIGRNQRGVAPARTPSTTPTKPGRQVRPPVPGLIAILLLGLVAGFFAWVSAEPLLLAAGHAERGTATVTDCAGSGIRRQCVVSFRGPTFSAARATLVGGSPEQERRGSSAPASMVSSHGRIAYAGGAAGLQVRWAVDVALVLLTGLAMAWASGARRLPTRRDRVGVTAASLLAPLLFLVGMIIAAW